MIKQSGLAVQAIVKDLYDNSYEKVESFIVVLNVGECIGEVVAKISDYVEEKYPDFNPETPNAGGVILVTNVLKMMA